MRKRVYIAGPFTAPNAYGVERNVRRAEDWVLPIAVAGGAPVCPHTMYRTFDGTLSQEAWIDITLSLLAGSDAIFMLPNYQESPGSMGEVEYAAGNQIPIFYGVAGDQFLPTSLRGWLKGARG